MNNERKELKAEAEANYLEFGLILDELLESKNFTLANKLSTIYHNSNRIRYKEGAAMVQEIYKR